jgi:hypothetical protein
MGASPRQEMRCGPRIRPPRWAMALGSPVYPRGCCATMAGLMLLCDLSLLNRRPPGVQVQAKSECSEPRQSSKRPTLAEDSAEQRGEAATSRRGVGRRCGRCRGRARRGSGARAGFRRRGASGWPWRRREPAPAAARGDPGWHRVEKERHDASFSDTLRGLPKLYHQTQVNDRMYAYTVIRYVKIVWCMKCSLCLI